MNSITYEFPLISWDKKRVRDFFDNSQFVFNIRYDTLTNDFTKIFFSLDEDNIIKCELRFLGGRPTDFIVRSELVEPDKALVELTQWRLDHLAYVFLNAYLPKEVQK